MNRPAARKVALQAAMKRKKEAAAEAAAA